MNFVAYQVTLDHELFCFRQVSVCGTQRLDNVKFLMLWNNFSVTLNRNFQTCFL